ncbi:MAG: hypothetical protein GY855_16520, partial [candidate division Zixibacteria bacterium]|nr:hypothetical protein [candidate division Zixibacteria bacterium]
WNSKLDEVIETDPVFLASFANAISETDIAYWNSKLDEVIETDPVFLEHPSSNITEDNIENWEDVYVSYVNNENEYLRVNSLVGQIKETDTASWNSILVGALAEVDPIFISSPAFSITAQDTLNLDSLSGINTGDHDMGDYVTKANLSDSINALRDSIGDVRIALLDSIESFHEELIGSVDGFHPALHDSTKDFRLALKDSTGNVCNDVIDSIGSVDIE